MNDEVLWSDVVYFCVLAFWFFRWSLRTTFDPATPSLVALPLFFVHLAMFCWFVTREVT